MKNKIFRLKPLILINSIMIFSGYVLSDSAHRDNKIIERPIRAELALKIGSDKANEDFNRLVTFAVAKNGDIYILDSGNSRIQCFSKE